MHLSTFAAVVAVAVSAPATPATTRYFTIVKDAPTVTHAALVADERAITIQVNRQVRKHWRVPRIAFTAHGGIPIHITTHAHVAAICQAEAAACHAANAEIYVERGANAFLSYRISHEVIEALVDPSDLRSQGGLLVEPCDPVDEDAYQIGTVMVADFVYPRWFLPGTKGPWDFMHVIRAARRPDGDREVPVGVPAS